MSVFKKGQTWYVDYYVDGKRKREAVGQNRKLAERVLAKRKVQIAEHKFLDIRKQSNQTFDQLAKMYIEYARVNKRSWKRDEYSIKHLSALFAGKKVRYITPHALEEYKAVRLQQVKPATLNRELNCFKHMFSKAIQWGMLSVNPGKSVKLIRVNNARVRFLNREECERLYRACSDHLKPIVLIALHTGMRRGEILHLKWDDIDFNNRLIHIRDSKSGEPRKIPISSTVFRTLAQLRINGPFVFAKHSGDKRRDIRTAFTNALKRANIAKLRFHDLRHTFASHLVMNGVDLLTVKELLGHKSIDMTLRYSHLSPSHKRKAVESLKLLDRHFMDTSQVSAIRSDRLSGCAARDAEVVKLVDALRSGRSSLYGSGGSSPPFGIILSHNRFSTIISMIQGFFRSIRVQRNTVITI